MHHQVKQLWQLLNRESGLKGISGISADMRVIEKEAASGNGRAELAFDILFTALPRILPLSCRFLEDWMYWCSPAA